MKLVQVLTVGWICLVGCVASSQASILFSETFDKNTSTTAETLFWYPDFTFQGSASSVVKVTGGVLELPKVASTGLQQFYTSGFAGDLRIDLDLGKTPAGPLTYVGLRIGGNRLLFHPGTSGGGFPAGAFRVDGNGGFANEDMGFVPAAGILHHMEVLVSAATGEFNIKVTDGNNASNVYTRSFTNTNYAPGTDVIGFVTNGTDASSGTALFDNFYIRSTAAVPEPSSMAVFAGLGMLACGVGLIRRRRNRTALESI